MHAIPFQIFTIAGAADGKDRSSLELCSWLQELQTTAHSIECPTYTIQPTALVPPANALQPHAISFTPATIGPHAVVRPILCQTHCTHKLPNCITTSYGLISLNLTPHAIHQCRCIPPFCHAVTWFDILYSCWVVQPHCILCPRDGSSNNHATVIHCRQIKG